MLHEQPVVQAPVGSRALRGALLLTGSTYAAILLGIAARKILSILLTPEQFGHISTALSFVDVIFAFASFSFSSAVINVRENLLKAPLAHLKENIVLLTGSVGLAAMLIAIAIALLFPPEGATTIFIALASIYAVQRFVSMFDTFYAQIIERELDYRKISLISFITNVLLHAIAVVLAWGGSHAFSIPVATLASTLVSAWLHRRATGGSSPIAGRPWRYYDRATAKWLWSFGAKVMGNRLFESWLFRIDNLLVFYLMNYAMLGFYSQAFMIAQMAAAALAPIVSRVSIATYAEVQHDRAKLEEAFAITNFFLVRLLIPMALVYAVAAEDLVRVFLSSKWYASAEPLAALVGFVLTTPLLENAKMLLGARLRLAEITYVRMAQLAAVTLLIFALQGYELAGIGYAVSIVSVVGYVGLMTVVRQEVSIRVREIYLWPVLIGLVLCAAVIAFDRAVVAPSLPPGFDLGVAIQRLFIYAILLLATQIGLEYLFRRKHMSQYFTAITSRF